MQEISSHTTGAIETCQPTTNYAMKVIFRGETNKKY
jgi:hypothetical protein